MSTIKHDTTARGRHRTTVLRALGKGPQRGEGLRSDLAVSCGGTRENVGSALNWLRGHGLAKADDGVINGRATWSITELGVQCALALRDGADINTWVKAHEQAQERAA